MSKIGKIKNGIFKGKQFNYVPGRLPIIELGATTGSGYERKFYRIIETTEQVVYFGEVADNVCPICMENTQEGLSDRYCKKCKVYL